MTLDSEVRLLDPSLSEVLLGESLAARLRQETRTQHTEAERSGIMRKLLTRSLEPGAYTALLRNLLPVYAALEQEFVQRQADPIVSLFYHPGLARVPALEHDLACFGGPGWRDFPVVAEAIAYADQIHRAASKDPALLVAHAYVRYLGDLSGGQILRKIVAESFGGLGLAGTAFYDFPGLGDLDAFKQQYRGALDRLTLPPHREELVVGEAIQAFEANTRLFAALDSDLAVPA